jgi:hypothetical protein
MRRILSAPFFQDDGFRHPFVIFFPELPEMPMNTKTIVAVLLVTLGIVVLAYSGITFTTPGKPVNFLGLHIETTDSHFIPPVVGALALVGGIVLLVVKPRRV